jgi:hypothetical protein
LLLNSTNAYGDKTEIQWTEMRKQAL